MARHLCFDLIFLLVLLLVIVIALIVTRSSIIDYDDEQKHEHVD